MALEEVKNSSREGEDEVIDDSNDKGNEEPNLSPTNSPHSRHQDWLQQHNLSMSQQDYLDAVPENISFSLLDAFGLLFSIGSYLFDIVTDVTVATVHYLNHNYIYFYLTLSFVLLPTLVVTIISLRWYIQDARKNEEGYTKATKLEWCLRFLFLLLQLGPIMRYIDSLVFGFKFRQTTSHNHLVTRQYYLIITDATMLRLFESFMEAAPQLVLQIYILFNSPTPNVGGRQFVIIQLVSIFSSLVSLSWSLVAYFRILRMSLPNKRNITWPGTIVMFLWKLCMIFSRVLAIALAFSSIFSVYVGIFCFAHIFLMFLWIVSMRTKFGEHWFDELLYNLVLGVIFLFCFFSPLDGPTRWRYAFYYTIIFIENSLLLAFWYQFSQPKHWYHAFALAGYYVLFFSGISFMIVYYLQFHPNLCRQQPSPEENEIAEEASSARRASAQLDLVAMNSPAKSSASVECNVWTTKEYLNNVVGPDEVVSQRHLQK